MALEHVEVRPLSPHIGAEVLGIDLREPLGAAELDALHALWMKHQVLFFRDQDLSMEQHKAFGRRFGELHVHPAAPAPEGHPEILVVHADEKSRGVAGQRWHSDVSCEQEPPMASILRITEVPEVGGDTLFCSMYAAYEALSPRMQALLDGAVAVHKSDHVYVGRYYEEGEQVVQTPQAEHPVVRTHPVTGRKALFVNEAFTDRIRGMRRPESDAILGFLYEHVRRPDYQCRFRWEPSSIAFWDNRCVQHLALWDYYPAVRHGYRVTVAGDRPV